MDAEEILQAILELPQDQIDKLFDLLHEPVTDALDGHPYQPTSEYGKPVKDISNLAMVSRLTYGDYVILRYDEYMRETSGVLGAELEKIKANRSKPKKGTKERMQQIHRLQKDRVGWKKIWQTIRIVRKGKDEPFYTDVASIKSAYSTAKKDHADWFDS